MNSLPIGIIDSGIGGLTVLKALRERLPQEDFLYFADIDYAPYGNKLTQDLRERNQRILSWIMPKVKLTVIACHTSSYLIQTRLPSVMTMIQASLDAVMPLSFAKGLAILATPLAAQHKTLEKQLQAQGFSWPIHTIGCPELATLIEGARVSEILEKKPCYLALLDTISVDYVFYGCTHYPLAHDILSPMISVPTVDPAFYVARNVFTFLESQSLLNPEGDNYLKVYFTGHQALMKLDFYPKDAEIFFINLPALTGDGREIIEPVCKEELY